MRITVIGTGYLGAVHAAGMAALGHDVLGVDADHGKIEALRAGRPPFFEPGLGQLLTDGIAAGRLSFSDDLDAAVRHADVHFVCVGTPQLPGSDAADLRFVDAVVTGLAERMTRPGLIVGKSTVPVGTARRLRALAATLSSGAARLAWNPEFLREGFAVEDTLHPDRLVFGTSDPADESVLRDVYSPLLEEGTALHTLDLETAELVKVAANSFLATKISFINAMAEVCEATGADVTRLADAIGDDPRIGRRFLNAGIGFGGGCLGKDIRAFRSRADELGSGEALRFLGEVDAINDRRRSRVVDLATDVLDGRIAGRRIALLGAAFKPNSDDVRDSPALFVAERLRDLGADVIVHDPEAADNARRALPGLETTDRLDRALNGAELVVHLTEWTHYRRIDPRVVASLVDEPVIIDARSVLDADAWSDAGWTVHSLGRPVRTPVVRPRTETAVEAGKEAVA